MDLNKYGGIDPIDVRAKVVYKDDLWLATISLDNNGTWDQFFIESGGLEDLIQAVAMNTAEYVTWFEEEKKKTGNVPDEK